MRPSAPPSARPWYDRPSLGITAALFVLALLVYGPALDGAFLWDDGGHVTRPELRSLGGLARIWFDPGATQQYYPLLHSAFWLQSHLWGNAPAGYHVVNVLLHATAAALLAAALRRLGVRGSWFGGLLFLVHPVCVESVAWISEQKNTLSLVLYLTAALAYWRFEDERKPGSYLKASIWFLAALATKTVTASLPAALLVVAWWRRGRIAPRQDVAPLLPWFGFSLGAAFVTAWFERTLIGAQGGDFALGWADRIVLAGRVIWFYLGKLAWPTDLLFVYSRWQIDASVWWQWLFPAAAAALAFGLAWRGQRGVLAAYLLFVGGLFPALGFVNVYPFVFSYVADHFQYLPALAVFALGGAALAHAVVRWGTPALTAGLLVVAVLAGLSWRHSAVFQDDITLFRATLRKNPDAWMAHVNLAEALARIGQHEETLPHLEAALRLKPDSALAHNNLGDNLRLLGRPQEAIPHFERAIALQPGFAAAHNNLGAALMVVGRKEEGLRQFREAVRLDPRYALAHRNLGLALATSGDTAGAIEQFSAAARLDPNDPETHSHLGVALTLSNRFAEAEPHFRRALDLSPDNPETFLVYGRALAAVGRHRDAVTQAQRAIDLRPSDPGAYYQLAQSLRQLGHAAEAAEALAEANRLRGAR